MTINSLDGQDIDGYAVDLYKQWGIGNKSTNRGVLILIAIKDHHYRTEVGYGLEPILPDGKVGGFWRQVLPLLKQGDYDGAIKQNMESIASVIAADAGVQLTGVNSVPAEAGATSALGRNFASRHHHPHYCRHHRAGDPAAQRAVLVAAFRWRRAWRRVGRRRVWWWRRLRRRWWRLWRFRRRNVWRGRRQRKLVRRKFYEFQH